MRQVPSSESATTYMSLSFTGWDLEKMLLGEGVPCPSFCLPSPPLLHLPLPALATPLLHGSVDAQGRGLGLKLRRVDRSQVSGCQMWQLHSQPCHSNHWGKRELSSPRRGFHSWFNLLLTFSKKNRKKIYSEITCLFMICFSPLELLLPFPLEDELSLSHFLSLVVLLCCSPVLEP